jgi:hypothetical protein
MFILDTHTHKLRFRIDGDAPSEYMNRWKKLKYNCETGENEYIIERMKTYCKLESTKTIPYLHRAEGGFGGDSNAANKQVRFRVDYMYIARYKDNDIVFDQVTNSDDQSEKWTYDELDDIIFAITQTLNYFVQSECVNGVIELSAP